MSKTNGFLNAISAALVVSYWSVYKIKKDKTLFPIIGSLNSYIHLKIIPFKDWEIDAYANVIESIWSHAKAVHRRRQAFREFSSIRVL